MRFVLCSVFHVIGGFDANQDGKITFGEFVQAMWLAQTREEQEEQQIIN